MLLYFSFCAMVNYHNINQHNKYKNNIINKIIITNIIIIMPLVRSSEVRVQVTVTDVNDNRPVFTEDDYVQDVLELIPVGASVIQVRQY